MGGKLNLVKKAIALTLVASLVTGPVTAYGGPGPGPGPGKGKNLMMPTPNAVVETGNSCYQDQFEQPGRVSRKMDLLFVVDSSGSLNDEKTKVANSIDSFISKLPDGVDYRISVMLAHGSKSSFAGQLYHGINQDDVLDSKKMTLDQIRDSLRVNLTSGPSDRYSDGGEEGLYSLTVGLDPAELAASREKGFFRPKAALGVVFVSDENDICADYPVGVVRVPDPEKMELAAKARDCIRIIKPKPVLAMKDGNSCKNTDLNHDHRDDNNGIGKDNDPAVPVVMEKISPKNLLRKLTDLQDGDPLVVAGIIYNNLATVPHRGENEFGYGYHRLIRAAHGVSVDLAQNEFSKGLEAIGEVAYRKLTLIYDFKLSHSNVDPSSLKVYVDNLPVSSSLNEGGDTVHLNDPGRALSKILVDYCVMPDTVPSPSPSPVPSPVPSVTPTPSPKPSPVPSVTPTPSPKPSPVPSVTPTPSPKPSPVPSVTPTPSPTPSPIPSATPTPTPSPIPSITPTPEPSPIPSVTPTPDPTPAPSPSPTCSGLDCGVFGT